VARHDSTFATFLLKNFLAGPPGELDEASAIDDCSPLQMYCRNILRSFVPDCLQLESTFPLSVERGPYALTIAQLDGRRDHPVRPGMIIGEYQIRWDVPTAGAVEG